MKTVVAVALVLAAVLTRSATVEAGCGCNKPPPPTADVRPAFAPPGYNVTLFSPQFVAGKKYIVHFGTSGSGRDVTGVAVQKRDLADGTQKVQLVVQAPSLPAGPTRIRVVASNNKDTILTSLPATSFTMLQAPLALAEGDGQIVASCYQAAVGADGTVYFPVDISAISAHMVFSGLAMTYPLLFNAQDIVIYNDQGFLMQLLGPDQSIYAITDPAGAPNSLELTYDRHEFQTYRDQHAHIGGLGLDPTDPDWHTDGTYHVDHDHLILAIRGVVENQGPAAAGATPPFTLQVTTALADGTNGVVTTRNIQWGDGCSSNGGPGTSNSSSNSGHGSTNSGSDD
ncbi:MAG TPA: hypothetical protein VGK30_20275 [Candidatus Binatia bacterium]|jgi:hypothetical protein